MNAPVPPPVSPRDGGPVAHAYRAPVTAPAMSAAAVVGLVLAFVFLLPALIGPFWLEAIAFVVSFVAMRRATVRGLRGRGIAIAGLVVSGGVATLGASAQHGYVTMAESELDRVMRVVKGHDADAAAKFVEKSEPDPKAAVLRWFARFDAAREAVGAYREDGIEVPTGAWGVLGSARTPASLGEEVGPRGGASPAQVDAVWARAAFERGSLWVAFEMGEAGQGMGSVVGFLNAQKEHDRRYVRDVRLFRVTE